MTAIRQKSTLSQDIQHEYTRLAEIATTISPSVRTLKIIDGTGGKVSAADIIAYQIGWSKWLIRWYKTGIRGEAQEMPGDGFSTWDYQAIARYFYQIHNPESIDEQMRIFHQAVLRIIEIVETEERTGNLDRLGVWPWCTLRSGKPWPLSKWIRVNTSSPYKKATVTVRKLLKLVEQ